MSDLYPYIQPVHGLATRDHNVNPPDRPLFTWWVKGKNNTTIKVQGIYIEYQEDVLMKRVVDVPDTTDKAQTFKDVYGVDLT